MLILDVNNIKEIFNKECYKSFFVKLIDILEKDFLNWNNFQKTKRVANYFPYGVIELMPICDNDLYSFKYVNGHPENYKLKKPSVMATGQLSNVKTGEPVLFSEMTLLTAIRTAATSALAGKYLANTNSEIISFIGTGYQSEFQFLAFNSIFNIKQLRYFDTDSQAMKKFYNNLKNFDIEFKECKSVEEAVSNADIITTMTAKKERQVILNKDMIKKNQSL